MKKVLFSVIGSHDPLSKEGEHGAMIHIVKNYMPEIVYLYFTEEMKVKENISVEAIKGINKNIEVRIIYSKVENVADFDPFYDEFSEIIKNIRKENEDAKILLNVTSGTSQMTLALCMEVLTHEEVLYPVQVYNPRYTKGEDRIVEPKLMALRKRVLSEQIKDMLEKWDYTGAWFLFKNSKLDFGDRLRYLLEHAYKRSSENKAAELIAKENLADIYNSLYPLKDNKKAQKSLDWLNLLQLKRDRKEITDFTLRAYSMAEFLVMKDVDVRLKGGLNSIAKNENSKWKWDKEKARKNHPELVNYLESTKEEFRFLNLSTFDYEKIVEFLNLDEYKTLFSTRKIRNDIAHNITPVTDEMMQKEAKTNSKVLLEKLRDVFYDIYKLKNNDAFDVFYFLNKEILKELNKGEN